jgi:hypothetical protein
VCLVKSRVVLKWCKKLASPTNFVGRFENVPTKPITIKSVKLLTEVAKDSPKQAVKEASKDVKEATKEMLSK